MAWTAPSHNHACEGQNKASIQEYSDILHLNCSNWGERKLARLEEKSGTAAAAVAAAAAIQQQQNGSKAIVTTAAALAASKCGM